MWDHVQWTSFTNTKHKHSLIKGIPSQCSLRNCMLGLTTENMHTMLPYCTELCIIFEKHALVKMSLRDILVWLSLKASSAGLHTVWLRYQQLPLVLPEGLHWVWELLIVVQHVPHVLYFLGGNCWKYDTAGEYCCPQSATSEHCAVRQVYLLLRNVPKSTSVWSSSLPFHLGSRSMFLGWNFSDSLFQSITITCNSRPTRCTPGMRDFTKIHKASTIKAGKG